MKLKMITAMKNTVAQMISPKKVEKAASVAVKDGDRMIANGQDAAAVQGRAMLKPYVKPEMKEVKLEKQNLKAASGDIDDRWGAREFNSDFEEGWE